MVGPFPDDGPAPPDEELIRQRMILRLEIATVATDRARLEYKRARLKKDHNATLAARYTEKIEVLNQLERSLREREARLTLRIHRRRDDLE